MTCFYKFYIFTGVAKCPKHEKCENGFKCLPDADFRGPGMWEWGTNGVHREISESQCAKTCMDNNDCKAYEYSKSSHQCKFVPSRHPNKGKHQDWKYCQKTGMVGFNLK